MDSDVLRCGRHLVVDGAPPPQSLHAAAPYLRVSGELSGPVVASAKPSSIRSAVFSGRLLVFLLLERSVMFSGLGGGRFLSVGGSLHPHSLLIWWGCNRCPQTL